MILADIRNYLEERGQASLRDIALHFDLEPDAARGMLAVWEKKGKLGRLAANMSCGSACSQCDSAAGEVYFWVNAATADRTIPVCSRQKGD